MTTEQDLLRPPTGRREEDADSEETSAPAHSSPGSPISSQTGRQVLRASLRDAVGPDGRTLLAKVTLSTIDLESWERVAKNYKNDPINTAKCLRYIIK